MLVDNRPVEVLAILPPQAEKVRKEDSSNKSIQYVALGILSGAVLVGIYYGINYQNQKSQVMHCLHQCDEDGVAWIQDWSKKREANAKAIYEAKDENERALLFKKNDQFKIDLDSKIAKCMADCKEDYNREASVKI